MAAELAAGGLDALLAGPHSTSLPIYELVERWRGLAVLQLDPHRYHQHLRRAAELLSGAPVPEDETIEQLRARIDA